jgi:hypothetical protein
MAESQMFAADGATMPLNCRPDNTELVTCCHVLPL